MSAPLFEIHASKEGVRLWLSKRLPLEPKGELCVARGKLRESLKQLEAPGGKLLRTTLTTIDESDFDAENLLLYNVGTGPFSALTRAGLWFEHIVEEPPTSPCGVDFCYLHTYEVVDPNSIPKIAPSLTIDFSLDRVSSQMKPHEVWWAVGNSVAPSSLRIPKKFGLSIQIFSPETSVNLAGIVKPLVDGIVSSLHSQQNAEISAVSRVAEYTGWSESDIRERLANPPAPVLGERPVLTPFRSFVKWNPADHLLSSCLLVKKQAPKVRCVAELFETD